MIRNALTGEPKAEPEALLQPDGNFTAESAPPTVAPAAKALMAPTLPALPPAPLVN